MHDVLQFAGFPRKENTVTGNLGYARLFKLEAALRMREQLRDKFNDESTYHSLLLVNENGGIECHFDLMAHPVSMAYAYSLREALPTNWLQINDNSENSNNVPYIYNSRLWFLLERFGKYEDELRRRQIVE